MARRRYAAGVVEVDEAVVAQCARHRLLHEVVGFDVDGPRHGRELTQRWIQAREERRIVHWYRSPLPHDHSLHY